MSRSHRASRSAPLLASVAFAALIFPNGVSAKPPTAPVSAMATTGKVAVKPVRIVAVAPKSGILPAKTVRTRPGSLTPPVLRPTSYALRPNPAARVPGFNTPASGADWRAAAVEITAAGRGRINYEAGVMKAIGLGAMAPPTLTRSRSQDILDAREAAVSDALRVLGIAASQVRVTADTKVANYVLKSDDIRVRVDGVVKNAEVIEEKMLPASGVYRVIVMAKLTGRNSLLEAVTIPKEDAEKKNRDEVEQARLAAVPTLAPPQSELPKPNPFAPGSPAPNGAEYTGLIVDCRGLGMSSCMSPRIYDEDGDEVYGTMKIEPDYVIETGIASFPRSMQEARRSTRSGERPLVVRACRVADENRYYAVLPRAAAARARAANQSSRYFERTAVLMLLDPIR